MTEADINLEVGKVCGLTTRFQRTYFSPSTKADDAVSAADRFGLFRSKYGCYLTQNGPEWRVCEPRPKDGMSLVVGSGKTFCEAICQAILKLSEKPSLQSNNTIANTGSRPMSERLSDESLRRHAEFLDTMRHPLEVDICRELLAVSGGVAGIWEACQSLRH